jgi:hypothetical protein
VLSRFKRAKLSRWGTLLLIAAAASLHCSVAPRHVEKLRELPTVTHPARLAAPSPAPVALASPQEPQPKTVVVIVIDGARWQEVFGGRRVLPRTSDDVIGGRVAPVA